MIETLTLLARLLVVHGIWEGAKYLWHRDTWHPLRRRGGYALPHTAAIALLAFALGTGTGWFAHQHYTAAGGVIPQRPSGPPMAIAGGALPASYSLDRYIVRLHDQGSSNSCVGQTLSTIREITEMEAGHRTWFSPEYIWGQLNGGGNNGITYQSAFELLRVQGDAPEATVGVDPRYYYGSFAPSFGQRSAAWPYRSLSYRWIQPWDIYTMQYEIAVLHHPLAVLLPWHDGIYARWGNAGPVGYDYGNFHFFHSVVAYAYDSYGVWLLNSWPGYGDNQRVHVAWSVLQNDVWPQGGYQGAVIYSEAPPRNAPPPKPHFPVTRWQSWSRAHHQHPVRYAIHGSIERVPWAWWRDRGASVRWGLPKSHYWSNKRHVGVWRFTRGTVYSWSQFKGHPIKFVRG